MPTYASFEDIRDALCESLNQVERSLDLDDDDEVRKTAERRVLDDHEHDVRSLYCAGQSWRFTNDRDRNNRRGSKNRISHNSQEAVTFFRRIIGDGRDDSRARIFSILLFSGIESTSSMWITFVNSLRLDEGTRGFDAFRDAQLPLPSDAIERHFGTENIDKFDQAQHEHYPIGMTSKFDKYVQDLRKIIEAERVQCEVLDREGKKVERELEHEFFPDSTPLNVVKSNQSTITNLYVESIKAQWETSKGDKPPSREAFRLLREADSEATTFYSGVQSCYKAFAVLVWMSVRPEWDVWSQFRSSCTRSDDSSNFQDGHFPLSYDTAKKTVGEDHGQDYFLNQFQFCAPILQEGEREVLEYKDPILPLREKEEIGHGSSGKVYRVKIQPGHFLPGNANKDLAMKEMPLDPRAGKELQTVMALRAQPEQSKAIMLPLAFLETKSQIFIFSDLADCDLEAYMESSGNLPTSWEGRLSHFAQMIDIASAVQNLHGHLSQVEDHAREVYFHLDIKASNILVTKGAGGRLRFQLTDFGISKRHMASEPGDDTSLLRNRATQTSLRNRNSNAPPEAEINKGAVNARADIWGYGTVLARFIVWMAKGYEHLLKFDRARLEEDGEIKGERFYCLENPEKAKLKDTVQIYLTDLIDCNKPEGNDMESLLYESTVWLLNDLLLKCDPQERGNIDMVCRCLSWICQSTPLDELRKYFCTKSRGTRKTHNDSRVDRDFGINDHTQPPAVTLTHRTHTNDSSRDNSHPAGTRTLDAESERPGRLRAFESSTTLGRASTVPEMELDSLRTTSQDSIPRVLTPSSTCPPAHHKRQGFLQKWRSKRPNETTRAVSSSSGTSTISIISNEDRMAQAVREGDSDDSGQQMAKLTPKERGKFLHQACREGNQQKVEQLIELGVDINAKDSEGLTALSRICKDPPQKNFHGILDCLLRSDGIDLEARDANKATPLLRVARNGEFKALHELLEKGAQPVVKDKYGYSPLHALIQLKEADVKDLIKDLLKRAPRLISLQTNRGQTALHICAELASDEAVKYARILLDENAEIDTEDDAGETPLGLASMRSGVTRAHQNMVGLLIENGASITKAIRNDPDRHHFEAIRRMMKI